MMGPTNPLIAITALDRVVCNESQGIFSCDLKGSNVIVSLRKTRHGWCVSSLQDIGEKDLQRVLLPPPIFVGGTAMAFLGTELIDFESAMDVSSREERVPHSVFSKGVSAGIVAVICTCILSENAAAVCGVTFNPHAVPPHPFCRPYVLRTLPMSSSLGYTALRGTQSGPSITPFW